VGREAGRLSEAVKAPVYCGDRYVAFGELTVAEVRSQAARLDEPGGWGPLARVAKVARAWRGLAEAMEASGAARVDDLDDEAILQWAERAWVIPPASGMI
jgi:hypothetical protein